MLLLSAFSASVLQMRNALGFDELLGAFSSTSVHIIEEQGECLCTRVGSLQELLLKLVVWLNRTGDLWGEEEEERASLVNEQFL